MGPSARALGWAGRFILIFAALYLATSLYSFFVIMTRGGLTFGQPSFAAEGGRLTLSVPLTLNNTGYYDLDDLRITTSIRDGEGIPLSRDETLVAAVARGRSVRVAHNVTLGLERMLSGNLTRRLVEDGEFKVDMSISLRYAQALGFRLGLTNLSLPWGAPLGSPSLRPGAVAFNGTHHLLRLVLRFENRSPFLPVSGRARLEIYNEAGEAVGVGAVDVNAPPRTVFERPLDVVVGDPSKVTRTGRVRLHLETPLFALGPVILPYG